MPAYARSLECPANLESNVQQLVLGRVAACEVLSATRSGRGSTSHEVRLAAQLRGAFGTHGVWQPAARSIGRRIGNS